MASIRPYQLADRLALIEAINGVCAEGMMRTHRFEPTPGWEHALEYPDCSCHLLLIAVKGPHVLGWCRLFPTSRGMLELGIGVVAPYRRRGIGRALLEAALAWALAQGIPILLETRTDNTPAIRLFTRVGFRMIGRANGQWQMRYP